jgi:hypothetical protein
MLSNARIYALLTNAEMCVHGSVSSCSSEVLVLSVWNVEVGFRITELLSKTEVDDIDLITTTANTHDEIIGLDIAVDEVARVDVFDARDLSFR